MRVASILCALAFALALLLPPSVAMGSRMMGGGGGGMMKGDEMQTIMLLLQNHEKITRVMVDTASGIRANTTSSDPQV